VVQRAARQQRKQHTCAKSYPVLCVLGALCVGAAAPLGCWRASHGAMLTTMGLKLACQHLLSAAEACMLQDRPLERVQPAAKRVQVSLMRNRA
jgi:hypothetical protein